MEIWKDIKGYEGLYQVSNIGRVKSLDRYNSNDHFIKGRILKLSNDNNGYKLFTLSKKNIRITAKVHRCVAIAFIVNYGCKPQVNHKDGIKYNNDVKNLEWCTMAENRKHAYKIGLQSQKGIKNASAIFTNQDIRDIKTLLLQKMTLSKIAKKYSCHVQTIAAIKQNRNWKHITI